MQKNRWSIFYGIWKGRTRWRKAIDSVLMENKYFTDITDKDKELIDIAEDDVIKFIEKNLLHIDNKIKSLKEK